MWIGLLLTCFSGLGAVAGSSAGLSLVGRVEPRPEIRLVPAEAQGHYRVEIKGAPGWTARLRTPAGFVGSSSIGRGPVQVVVESP
jgi:hypothetical protein